MNEQLKSAAVKDKEPRGLIQLDIDFCGRG